MISSRLKMAEKAVHMHVDMIEALLKKRKSQYRFALKQPNRGKISNGENGTAIETYIDAGTGETKKNILNCPLAKIGDTLWVKEPWFPKVFHSCCMDACDCADIRVSYLVGNEQLYVSEWNIPENWSFPKGGFNANKGYLFSASMPKWASRIFLKVKNIRVEQLWEINEGDAIAEGVEPIIWKTGECRYPDYLARHRNHRIKSENYTPQSSFFSFVESTKGRKFFESNPWVWVIEFEILEIKVGESKNEVTCTS